MRGAEGPNGRSNVSETAIEGAGRPVVKSRTWQVMGSRAGAAGGAEAAEGDVISFMVSSFGVKTSMT